MASVPDFVTTLVTEEPERPSSAENRFVAIWNSWTASSEMFWVLPPTASSLMSAPSMVTLAPRPSWPAEEMRTVLLLVGSKFGAGLFPGTRRESSRKLRPFSGRSWISSAVIRPSTTPDVVLTRGVPSTVTFSSRPPTFRATASSTVLPTARETDR